MGIPARVVRVISVALGLLFAAVGIVGVFLPVLPTTPFLLVASVLFLRSSPALHRRLTSHPRVGPAILRIQRGEGISLRTKVVSTTFAAVLIGAFALFGTESLHLRIFLAALIIAKIAAMVALPTYRGEAGAAAAPAATSAKPFRIRAPRLLTAAVFAAGSAFVWVQALSAIRLGAWTLELTRGVITVPVALIILAAARWGLVIANRWLGGTISGTVRLATRERLFTAIGRGGADAVRGHGIGTLHELMSERIESLDPMYSLFLPQLFIGLISPVLVIAVVASQDLTSGLVLLAILPVTPLILGLLARNFARVGKEYSQAAAALGAWYLESIRALPTLTIFQRVRSYRDRLAATSRDLTARTIRLLVVNQLALLLVEIFFSLAVLALATYLAVSRFRVGEITAAFAFAMPFLAIELIRPINLVGSFFFAGAAGRQSKKMIERMVGDLEAEYPVATPEPVVVAADDLAPTPDRDATETAQPSPVSTGLVVESASFAYPSNPERQILTDIDLHVGVGEIVGLKGPSGSGKSTLAKLILGYYRPDQGRILVDGADLLSLTPEQRQTVVGYLPQRPYIFARSLRDNLTMGRPGISDDDVRRALESVSLQDFIARGLDAPLGENASQISGGERMRVALARVLLSGARFVVLDEPTAEIDVRTEDLIVAELRASGVGVLTIAHRKSTLDACDRVVDIAPSVAAAGVAS